MLLTRQPALPSHSNQPLNMCTEAQLRIYLGVLAASNVCMRGCMMLSV